MTENSQPPQVPDLRREYRRDIVTLPCGGLKIVCKARVPVSDIRMIALD